MSRTSYQKQLCISWLTTQKGRCIITLLPNYIEMISWRTCSKNLMK
uniref:Uncharacterized protein n=1 Tax=Arundo donax TaxID=35708 RepID=A0A0A9CQJ0_ARUDO